VGLSLEHGRQLPGQIQWLKGGGPTADAGLVGEGGVAAFFNPDVSRADMQFSGLGQQGDGAGLDVLPVHRTTEIAGDHRASDLNAIGKLPLAGALTAAAAADFLGVADQIGKALGPQLAGFNRLLDTEWIHGIHLLRTGSTPTF